MEFKNIHENLKRFVTLLSSEAGEGTGKQTVNRCKRLNLPGIYTSQEKQVSHTSCTSTEISQMMATSG